MNRGTCIKLAKIEFRLVRDDLKKTLPILKDKLTRQAVYLMLTDLGNEFIIRIQMFAPRKTGDYANSWDYIANSNSLKVYTPQGFLMEVLEYGSSAHVIEGNPILSWIDSASGERLFAHFVNHPGTPAFPHVRPTIEYVNSIIPSVMKKVLRELNV